MSLETEGDVKTGVGRLCNQVEDSEQEENRHNILGVEALLMLLSSMISDACQRTTRQVIDRNKWLQEQQKQEKKDDLKLNQHQGTGKLWEQYKIWNHQVDPGLVDKAPCTDVEIEVDKELVIELVTCVNLNMYNDKIILL